MSDEQGGPVSGAAAGPPPALTSEEWERALALLPRRDPRTVVERVVAPTTGRRLAAEMALANAVRAEVDPGRLTWAMVDSLAYARDAVGGIGPAADGVDAAMRAIAALLPPRPEAPRG